VRMTVLAAPIVFASLLFVPYKERNEQRAKDPYRSFARSLRSEGDRRADTTRSMTGLLKREVVVSVSMEMERKGGRTSTARN